MLFIIISNVNSFEIIDKYNFNINYYPSKNWQKIKQPKTMNWSLEKLKKAEKYSNKIASSCVMIIDNGIVVHSWGDIHKKHNMYSIRKSFLSTAYGIYVKKGKINLNSTLKKLNINDKYNLTAKERKAKISDLLKARSGVYHPAAYETKSMIKKRPKRGSYSANENWYYNNWDFNTLLTIFEQETGKSFFKVFKNDIADPIGMQSLKEKDMRYVYSRKKSIHPAYPFKMNAIDLARFGLLMLREGDWKDKNIISQDWIRQSIKKYTKFKRKFCDGYGYMWWRKDEKFCASGYGGQWLIVDPKSNIIIVHLANKKNKINTKKFRILMNKILASKL